MATRTRLPRVTEYVKNVGKSIVFASIDSVKRNAEGIDAFLETNEDIMKDTYSSIKNYRQQLDKLDRSIKTSKVYQAVQVGVKNFIDDAKTGNFYNTTREKEYSEAALGLEDDFDFGDDFDSDSSTSGGSSSATALADSFEAAIGASATSHATAVARGTDLVIQSNRVSTKMIMASMDRMTAGFQASIGTVYSEIYKTNQFLNGPMQAHLENSKRYYEFATRSMQETQAMLKEMLEMQRNLYKVEQTYKPQDKFNQAISYGGYADIRGYAGVIKKNLKNTLDGYGLGMMDMMDIGGGNPYLLYAAAPMKMVMDIVADELMSKDLKKAIRSFDKSLSGMFSTAIARLNQHSDDFGPLGMLAQIFGVKPDKKETINTSQYKKGPVPFDGVTRKAIIEVIPGYLARIEAALTGSRERHYDQRTGTWKSIDQVEKEWKREKANAVASANSEARYDLSELVSQVAAQSQAAADALTKNINKMFTKIYDDGGVFRPEREDAWKYYGFKSKAEFDRVNRSISRNSKSGLAYNNMSARQNLSSRLRDIEAEGGIYNQLFNGAYDKKGEGRISAFNAGTGYKGGVGLLAASMDSSGRNIFWYLKEILSRMGGRPKGSSNRGGNGRGPRGPRPSGGGIGGGTGSDTDSSSDGGDHPSDSDDSDIPQDVWDRIDEEKRKREEEESKQHKAGNWFKDKFGNTKAGKAILEGTTVIGKILAKPLDTVVKKLNQADDNIYRLMFGEHEMKDDDGNPIYSTWDYIIYKIKKTFSDFTKWMKEKLLKPLQDWFKPIWEKYGKPVTDNVKAYASKGWKRAKQGFSNTFGKMWNTVTNGGVFGADDAGEAAANAETSASGRIVTKRGLTMISPGEVVLPASLDPKEQAKDLALERRDKRRILSAIGYNAKGNVDTDKIKDTLFNMYQESKGKGGKIGAGGVLGAGAGIVTGINPILGALAGSALSFITESDTAKDILFGKERDGSGLIPKKVYDVFKKSGSDMIDFGLAGGVLGLLTPFGLLGGAGIGAGIGMLKNNESFKKFIFGDAETGKDGLISEESFKKAKEFIKKGASKMAIGAVAAALAGPFGLVGNAALGAGLGLLTTTEGFHKVVFGDGTEDNKGIVGAFKEGFLEPAKDKFLEFAANFKDYAKKNILDPMKRFWDPFTQAVKNTITGVGDAVKDHLNDMFEKTIGIPLNDFLREKLFKPLSKVIFGIVKAPLKVGKAMVAAPFRALGAVGDSMRMRQIQKGTAYNMSASERLAFRDRHQYRNAIGTALGRDKMLEQDTLLSNMSEEDLATLFNVANVQIHGREEIQKQTGKAREAAGNEISKFFNTKVDGKRLYDRIGYGKVKKLAEYAADGDMDKFNKLLNSLKLSDEEKSNLRKQVSEKIGAARDAMNSQAMAGTDEATRDMELTRILGRKFRGRKDARQLFRSAEAELKARRKGAAGSKDESPEEHATNNLAELYKSKTDELIKILGVSNKWLQEIAHPGSTGEKTEPPGSEKPPKDSSEATEGSKEAESAAKEGTDAVRKMKNKGGTRINPVTGEEVPINPDSKESVEAKKEEEEAKQDDKENTEANKQTNTLLGKLAEGLIGDKKKKDKGEGGILGKIGGMFGGLSKFLGVGGKVALALTGASLFGHATEWFKTKIWPTIKSSLFGNENTGQNGVLSGVRDALIGNESTGKEGFLQKLCGWFGKKFGEFKEWYQGKGGISGIIVNDVLPKLIQGWGFAVDNVVAPLTALIIKSLPGIAIGLIKGVVSGLKMAIFNKKLTRSSDSKVNVETTAVQKEIESLSNKKSSSLTSSMGSLGQSLKNAFNTGANSAAYTAANAASIDLSVFGAAEEDKNNQKTTFTDNLLGSTHRTNEVEYIYDENGNPIGVSTDYTQMNKTDSALSRLGSSTGRGFMQGLSGMTTKASLIGKGLSAIKAGSGIGHGVIGLTTRGTTAALHGAGKALNAGSNAGAALNKIISEGANKTAGKAAAAAGNAASSKGLLGKIASGIKKIFSNLADSAVGSKICGWVSKVTGTSCTQAVMKKTLLALSEKLASKLGTNIASNALKTIATTVGSFSPLALALIIGDFWYGFDNADTLLGVAKGDDYQVGFGQKVVCALVNVVNNRITLGFIPTETVIDIAVEYIFPLFKIDAESLKQAQSNAAAIMDQWNLEHPDEQYDNLQDFNNKDKLLTKAWKGIKGAAGNAWGAVKKGASNIASGAKNLAGKAIEGFKTGFNNVSNWIGDRVDDAKSMGTFIKDVTREVIKSATDPEYHWDINSYLSKDDPLSGAKKSLYQVLKIPLGVIGVVSAAGSAISKAIGGFVGKVKDGGKDALEDVKNVAKGQYTIFNKDYWKTNNEDPNNPLSTLSTVSSMLIKGIGAPVAMVGFIGSKAKQLFNTLVAGAKEGSLDATSDVNAVKSGQYTIFNANYWNSDNLDGDNPLSKLGSIFGFASRVVQAPIAMLGYVGTKVKQLFDTIKNGATEGSLDATSDVEAVKSGQYTIFSQDYWSSDVEDTGNPLSKLGSVFGFASRVVQAPVAMLGYVGTKVKAAFDTIREGASEGVLDATADVDAVKSGQYTIFSQDYWHSDAEETGNPLSKLGSIFGFVSRITQAPVAMIGYVGTKVKEGFTKLINGVKDISESTDKTIKRAEDGEISVFSSEYWKLEDDSGNPLGILGNIVSFVQRLVQAPIVIFKNVFNKIKEKFDEITGWFKKLFGEDAEEVDEAANTDSGSGRNRNGLGRLFGRAHMYQQDPKFANQKYGDSTIGEAGCAPVAATNLINQMNGGMTVGAAAKYAETHGKTVPGGGTDISYFNSILGSQGIPSTNTSSKSEVLNALKGGNPVVMLGKDQEDPNGPFGTSPHFITANGLDRRGNIIAEDPDLPESQMVYDKNKVLNSMITSVATKRGSKRNANGTRIRYGRGSGVAPSVSTSESGRPIYFMQTDSRWANTMYSSINDRSQTMATSSCGPTSASMLINTYVDRNYTPVDCANWCVANGYRTANNGSAWAMMKALAEKFGFTYFQTDNIDKAYNFMKTYPNAHCICIMTKGNWTSGGHYILCWKMDDTYVYINDPASTKASRVKNTKKLLASQCRQYFCFSYSNGKSLWLNDVPAASGGSIASTVSVSDSSMESEPTSGTLLSGLTNLGKSMLNAMYGKDAVTALFGSTDSSTMSSTSVMNSGLNMSAYDSGATPISADESKDRIWQHLKQRGYNEYARAGIMGCWQQESSNRADRVEGDYLKGFPGFRTVLASNQALNNYTTGRLFPAYARSNISINKDAYKGTDGNYYPGIGLAQWTGPRGYKLFKFAQDQKKDWRDLDTQLAYFDEEDASRGLKAKMNTATSAADGAYKGLAYYEMSEGYASSHPSAVQKRAQHANGIYNTYAGKGRNAGGAGMATKALNSHRVYYGGAGQVATVPTTTTTGTAAYQPNVSGGVVDYATFLKTIVNVLMNISSNTALLTKILEILSNKFELDIDKSDIEAASKNTKAQTEAALNELISRSSGNNRNLGKILNNKDTTYILQVMNAIAAE